MLGDVNSRMRLRGIAAALFLIVYSSASLGEINTPVFHYAGIAYLGDYQYVEENYSLTRWLNGEDAALDRALLSKLQATPPEHMDLRFELADLNNSESRVLAIAVENERVSAELFDINGVIHTKLIVEISLQLLFYDFDSMSLTDNYPVSVAINHLIAGRDPEIEQASRELAHSLYTGGDSGPGILDQITEMLRVLAPRESRGLRFQMASIDIAERVLPLLPENLTAEQFSQLVGQLFSAELSKQTQVDVLPYTRGYAIGNQLPGRFSNGGVFNLQLPEADYNFALTLKNLTKNEAQGNFVYGAQAGFEVSEPFSGKKYVNGDFRMGIYKLGSENSLSTDDWSAYEDVVFSLADELIEQLRAPSKKWHNEHARDKKSFSQFRQLEELFNG